MYKGRRVVVMVTQYPRATVAAVAFFYLVFSSDAVVHPQTNYSIAHAKPQPSRPDRDHVAPSRDPGTP